MSDIILHEYWRSSSSYRVRIALNLKNIAYQSRQVNLLERDQKSAAHLAMNPQGMVPILSIDGHHLTQSVAIMEYLDHEYPEPALFPPDPLDRARTMAQLLVIVAEIQPINNLGVGNYLKSDFGADGKDVVKWMHHWMADGFAALEQMAPDEGLFGGENPNIVDVCLVPQFYNARRFETDLGAFPNLVRIDALCQELEPFQKAHPDAVKESES